MSTQITTAFVEQYRNNVELLVQQRGSVLRDFVNVDNAIVGKTKFTEQIGSTEAQKKVSRHSDSPLVNTPHARRAYSLEDYEWGDLIDKNDKVRMLIDPTSSYAQAAAFAMGRAMDDVIIAAATGTAKTGVSGGTDTDLPASQKVLKDSQDNDASPATHGLSPQKLRAAMTIFHENSVPEDEEKFMVVSPKAIQSLLTHKEVASTDFNTVRALVNGEIDTFMGFRFIISNRLAVASNVRDCFAYVRSGIELGVGQDVMARIEERPDKSFSTYVYYCMTIGATRLEEEKVVKIEVDEAAISGAVEATI